MRIDPICPLCQERVAYEDAADRYGIGALRHRNCDIRAVLGSVAHFWYRCSCYVQ